MIWYSHSTELTIGSDWAPMLQDAQVDWIKKEATINFKIILTNFDCILYRYLGKCYNVLINVQQRTDIRKLYPEIRFI